MEEKTTCKEGSTLLTQAGIGTLTTRALASMSSHPRWHVLASPSSWVMEGCQSPEPPDPQSPNSDPTEESGSHRGPAGDQRVGAPQPSPGPVGRKNTEISPNIQAISGHAMWPQSDQGPARRPAALGHPRVLRAPRNSPHGHQIADDPPGTRTSDLPHRPQGPACPATPPLNLQLTTPP